MKIGPTLLLLLLLLPSVVAAAEPFATKHTLTLGLGWHSFYPEDDEHEGVKPNQDGEPTDAEFAYMVDEGYDIGDFNGAALDLGYRYRFIDWFSLGANCGFYGKTAQYKFTVERIDTQTEVQVTIYHLDLLPRFHWQTRWIDLFGGPLVGLYTGHVVWDVTARFQEFKYTETEEKDDTALGWGADLGLEVRLSEHWGVMLEDRLTSAVLFTDRDDPDEWLNAGGNLFLVQAALHF
ncbi:MAG TPA: outer membrane beta-barrel protein [bacterium]|nr:outer membrane beta-barrel protein [bacterium]